jgi:hypothetical protein
MGNHPNRQLQADWNKFGGNNFAFEIVDQLPRREDPNADYRADLVTLADLWLEDLHPFGDAGYNERKLSREGMPRKIAAQLRANAE